MFQTKNLDTTRKEYSTSKYLSPGKFQVKVNSVIPYKANSGSYQLRFELETPPVTTEGFVPAEGYHGQIGTVRTVYMAKEEQEQQVSELIARLADSIGAREKVDSISSEVSMEEYCSILTEMIKDQYFWVSISGKKYINNNTGKPGTELQFSRFKTFASLAEVDEKGIDKVLANPYIKELPADTGEKKEEVLF